MELPVVASRYEPPAAALVRAIKRVDVMVNRMIADEADLDGATAFTNADRPTVHMANCAAEVRLGEGQDADALLDRIDAHFAEVGTKCWYLMSSELDWPEALAEAAKARGFEKTESGAFLLDPYKPPKQLLDNIQIIPGRAAYGELRELGYDQAREDYGLDDDRADQLVGAMIDRLDEPQIEVFLGRIDKKPVGNLTVVTVGQVGVIDAVYTMQAWRRKGVARTLMHHAVEYCQRAGFEQVVLESVDPGPTALYESLGFRRIATITCYDRPT